MTTPDELRSQIQQLATELDLSPLSFSTRERAARASKALHATALTHDVDDRMVSALSEELFNVTNRAHLGAGPMRESARRIRGLIDVIAPPEVQDLGDSPVLTPEEAARYLSLGKLGVTNPAERVRYLVKTKRLRSIQVLGRTAFQRSDLDEYLIRHAAKVRKSHARTQHPPQRTID